MDGSDESIDLCKNKGKCGGSYTDHEGLLTSPSYPDNYPDRADCIYTLSLPNDTFLNLKFLTFDLDATDCKDYLEIRDGDSEKSPLIGTFCGTKIAESIQSTQNQLWMK